MISLELVALEPYENGELKPHTAGIIRDIEEKNEIFEEEDKFERVEIRRGLEIRLVHKFDKSTINARRECWFLMDTVWLNKWAEYVENKEGAEPPGRLSTADLRDEEGIILPNLQAKLDYRGVPPTVYFIFKELYGKDETDPICRYTVDIYNMRVPDEHYIKIIKGPAEKARIMVNKCRSKYVKWGEELDDGEDPWCCCGLTMDHVESILYWVLTCGKRGRSGRSAIKYTDYKPLKRTKGDGDDLSEWSMRSNSTLGSIDSSVSSSASIGHADRDYGQEGMISKWVMGMVGYSAT